MLDNIKVIILGAGGHAKVLIDSLMASGVSVWGCTTLDRHLVNSNLLGVPVHIGDQVIEQFDKNHIELVNGVGSSSLVNKNRQKIYNLWKSKGYKFHSVIHPNASIEQSVKLESGVQIMSGVTIQPDCFIGENTIINTRASIDHDCKIGKNVHIAPGVIMSGGVTVGDGSFIGVGAVVIQGVKIGSGCMVAAGAVAVKDIPDNCSVKGVPAK
jgi:sugar O-acyltransferase (sialic acid O-acetyltransferase NeuD family)